MSGKRRKRLSSQIFLLSHRQQWPPTCDWIYVAEDLEDEAVVVMSYWQSEAGFDDHLRWRIGTSRWTEMEQKYLEGEPEYKLMPVMFRFRDHG